MAAISLWERIPEYALGDAPEDLPEKLYRQIIAKRALQASYEAVAPNTPTPDPEDAITDMLADLRHLCDGLNLDFAQLDRKAYKYYIEENSRLHQPTTKGGPPT